MRSQPNQDQLTKFVQWRAVKSKHAEEVANHLIDIFTICGASSVPQSGNGRDFSNQIVEEAYAMRPNLKIVTGKPRHSQIQGSVEHAN